MIANISLTIGMGPGTVPSVTNVFNSHSNSDVSILIISPFYT